MSRINHVVVLLLGNRASIEDTVESVVAGVPVHPGDEPLDSLTEDWAMGMLSLLHAGLESAEPAPTTQGEAAVSIARALRATGL
jgi:hypothetical protein